MSTPRSLRRVAGVTVPLFSLRTERSWGIGEIGDLAGFARWTRDGGLRLVQLLPLGEIAGGETSPYSALSAFGIDPIYLSLDGLDDLPREEQRDLLGDDGVRTIEWLRGRKEVEYEPVRWLKNKAFRAAFGRFHGRVYGTGSERDRDFERFRAEQREWLGDYALFRALKDAEGQRPWWEWPEALRDRRPDALAAAREAHADAVLLYEYLQWLAHRQWEAARAELKSAGVEVMGDLPFMVGRDSADLWSCREGFRDDARVGVPADQFDPVGQEWGLAPYDWRAMRRDGFRWLRRRARYAGSLYDRFRIDHLVGFYRTYTRPADRLRGPDGKLLPGTFDPPDEPSQLAHGEAVLRAMIEAAREEGAELIAEDLGSVPDYVRPSLLGLGVAGYKVLIWEKDGDVFRDPARYPALSVACFGTHDTDPVAVWWESLPAHERAAVCRLPALAARGGVALGERFTPEVHRALMELVMGAASELVLLLAQDVLGARDRVNTPASVGAHNWTWRLPATVAELAKDGGVRAKLAMIREAAERAGR